MMGRSRLDLAKKLLKRRKFAQALSILEDTTIANIYKDDFNYYLTAGIACMYLGDTGNAKAYFDKARRYRTTDPTLINAQAVLFLRRGDTINASMYYLDVLEYDPENKTAKAALDFIKNKGTPEQIARIVDTGEIRRFYPQLGVNSDIITASVFAVLLGVMIAFSIIFVSNSRRYSSRRNINLDGYSFTSYSDFMNDNPNDPYFLTDKEIKKSWENIKDLVASERDNAARVEINRLLNSNASTEVKTKVLEVAKSLDVPEFTNIKDTFSLETVLEDPLLYSGCYVYWSGRVMNEVVDNEADKYSFDLFMEDKAKNRMLSVHVVFSQIPAPPVDSEKEIKVYGCINFSDGKIVLSGKTFYQSIR